MELIIDGIHKNFGDNHVLKGAQGRFLQGRIYALLGRNGAGKTTLFDIIADKKKPDEGSVRLYENGQERRLENRDMFYMVANPLLPHFLTGREFAQFFIDVNRDRIKDSRTPDELFDWLELDEKERDRLIQGYSLGTKNKLQMLMFLLTAPPVILMDEPLTSLDVIVQLQIKRLLKDIEKDHIILFFTHILQLARDLCDELVILNHGILQSLPEGRLQDPSFEEEIVEILRSPADV